MLMQVLEAGGLTPLISDVPKWWPKAANLNGYYQHMGVVKDPAAILGGLNGSYCVKVSPINVGRLLPDIRPELAVVTRRAYTEIKASSIKFFGADRQFVKGLDIAAELLYENKVPVIEVNFHDLIDHTERECRRIADVMPTLNLEAMLSVPDPSLRHFGPEISSEEK